MSEAVTIRALTFPSLQSSLIHTSSPAFFFFLVTGGVEGMGQQQQQLQVGRGVAGYGGGGRVNKGLKLEMPSAWPPVSRTVEM